MKQQLIRLDDKHIFIGQMKMSVDRVLQCFTRNIPGPPSLLIENYLREVGFWHVANIGRGCKLDLKLISAFVERRRSKMHTFHLPYRECIITLGDLQLQLRLLVDGTVLTGSTQFADWESYVMIFWVKFWILFTKVRLIWVGYKRHSQCPGMIRLKYKEYNTLGRTSFTSSKFI
ncbi:hypothetical protein J1N35_043237 [Gossypium stocksii]|uniref:Aminotransferase-like plant mobile domain-containing protein n=1 Tax=Gossypium stocksii TaxID=47602 RepID=A0A9D3U731_9ROSI|nr:hypothetical protein J1N35_043237 [Gossypium stocksii]